ncbi:MAG TPA: gluconokinase [Mycobacteriales bacterium]|jgi:gluconokinase|nr:gluconokinase [Mycobacteriales bacterium]
MGDDPAEPTTLVVMGVSGSGKTTVARGVADALGWAYAEGDEFHPRENVAKMAAGQPLDDADRWPWLRAIADSIGAAEEVRENQVVTCSALKRSYRDLLRDGHPSVRFCLLDVSPAELRRRLESRRGHYMPASLLDSQLATLEPLGADEPGITVPADTDPDGVRAAVLDALRTGAGS